MEVNNDNKTNINLSIIFSVRNVKTKVVKKMVTAHKGTEYVANVSHIIIM